MGLLDLPYELIDLIVAETLPEGIEQLALTCKAVHGAALPHVARHNELKRRYRHFRYHSNISSYASSTDEESDHSSTTESPREDKGSLSLANASEDDVQGNNSTASTHDITCSLQLLYCISQEPLIASYIEYADFYEDAHGPTYPDVHQSIRDDDVALDAIKKLIQEDPDYHSSPDFETVFDRMTAEENGHEVSVPFLLTLLPNVRELTLPRKWAWLPAPEQGSTHKTHTSLLLIILTKRASDSNLPLAGLSRLETILPCRGTGYENRMGLQCLFPFLEIGTVRNLYAGSCIALDDGYTGIALGEIRPPLGANLQLIELAGACVGSSEISELLSHTPRLKTFRFSYQTKWHGCGGEWDARAFCAAIKRHVGHTIETLSLSIFQYFGDFETPIDSMQGFEKLKDLEIDTRLWEVVDEPNSAGSSTEQHNKPNPIRLIDVLPSSLERLDILSRGAFEHLFYGFETGEGTTLPKLAAISISGEQIDFSQASEQVQAAVGRARVKVVEASEPTAAFQRTFSARFHVDEE